MNTNSKISTLVIFPIIIALFLNSFFIVNEFEQAIVLQFGKPISSKVDSGIYFKTPFIQNVIKFEKRILEWDGNATEIPTKGMNRKSQSNDSNVTSNNQETTNIFIDTFARWKISDPLKFYISVNNEVQAQSRLDGIIDGKIRDAIAPKYIDDIVENSSDVMGKALKEVQLELENLDIGIEVIGIEIKRFTFNNQIMPQVFDRMASEQEAEAAKFEGLGKAKRSEMLGKIEMQVDSIISAAEKQARIIEGEADALAAKKYALTYKSDHQFYEFWKISSILPEVLDNRASIVLTPENLKDPFNLLPSSE